MKNKRFWSFLIFVLIGILLVGIIYSIANKEHQPSEILLTINGYEMTLQEAVNNGFLSGSSPSQDYTTEADLIASGVAYHTGDEIYVSVDGSEGTLNSLAGSGLCSSGASSYSGDLSVGHSGDEIYIDGVNTLQDAINNGDYCFEECGAEFISCAYNTTHYVSKRFGNGEVYWGDINFGSALEETDEQCPDCDYYVGKEGNYFYYAQELKEDGMFRDYYSVCRVRECCTSHASSGCSGGDIYWFDSCGNKEELKEDCSDVCLVTNAISRPGGIYCFKDFYNWEGTCTDFCDSQGLIAGFTGQKCNSVSGGVPPSAPQCDDSFIARNGVGVYSDEECGVETRYNGVLDRSFACTTTMCSCVE